MTHLRIVIMAMAIIGSPASGQAVDVAAGQKKARACFACHGEDGIAVIPGTPHLAGQDHDYLAKALRDYQRGHRQDPTMRSMAASLTDQDILNIAAYFSLAIRDEKNRRVADALALAQRLQTVGTVRVKPTPSSSTTQAQSSVSTNPRQLYQTHCAACHSTGAAGAPKVGESSQWASRIAQGRESLLKHATEGLGAMPAKGLCQSCSAEDLTAIIDYMLEESR
ncbi:c-type cytochrome [Alcanivorax sp. 24]|uniref:c-type cytochrome n=1 Tax=Alcanivorax sp. 24 TaxID=2545266 RepID=UPI00105B4C6B|nr:c-type cytochrome [Alcanivorax sp. 24]